MTGTSEVESLALCDVLREFRLERQMSKRALSQRAGLSASYVGKMERAEIEPSVHAFAVISLALGLAPHEILFCVRCALAEARAAGQPQLGAGEVPDAPASKPGHR